MANDLNSVLRRIAELQESTAPVQISIGYTDHKNTVKHDGIVVHSAPPKVVSALVSEYEFVRLEAYEGLVIPGVWRTA